MILDLFGMFRTTRRWVGGVLIIIAIVMSLPAVFFFMLSGAAYGDPMTGYPKTGNLLTGPQTFNLSLKANNDYDIKYTISVSATAANPATGSIAVSLSGSATGGLETPSNSYADSNFNSTSMSGSISYPNKLSTDGTITMIFTMTSNSSSITSAKVTVYVYENPHRTTAGILSTIGLILLIPAIIMCLIGAVISGPSKNQTRK